MASNTIDTLSIQINSSSQGATVAIERLLKNLEKLNGALENYASDSNKYNKAMKNIANGLNTLNSAMAKINPENLNAVSASVRSLATAGKKLNDTFGSLGMDKATRDANALSKEMDKAVKSIMAFYNVDKGAGKQIASDFADFMKGATWQNGQIEDMSNSGLAAWNNIGETLKSEARQVGVETGEMFSGTLLEYIKSNPIPVHLPFSWKEIEGDINSAKSVLASMFGVGGWTFSSPGNGDISEYVNQLNGDLGMQLDTSSDVAAFNALRDVVEQAKTGMTRFSESASHADVNLNELWGVLQRAASGVEQFKAKLNATDANPIQALASGLKQLEGIAIPDLSGVALLATNISKLGNKGASQGITNIPLLAQGLQSLSGLTIPNIPNMDSLNNLIATFNRLGGKKGNSASANIRPMIDGLRELSTLTGVTFPDSSSLLALANAFSAFGRSTTATAIANIPQLATAFRNLMATLSTAPTVSRNVIDLANALANLASQGGRVGTATDSMTRQISRMSSAISGFYGRYRNTQSQIIQFGRNLLTSARNAGSASRSYNNLASKVGLLYAKFWLLMRVFRVFNKAIGVASALTEVQNVVDTTFGNMSYKIEEFSKNAIKNFGMSELSAKQFASRFQAMGNAMGITGQQVAKAQQLISSKKTMQGLSAGYDTASKSMADMSINLTKLTADMASFYDVEQETVAKALQSGVMAGQTRPLILAA